MTDDNIQTQFDQILPENYPLHIAIIPNGHRTWARKYGRTTGEAHHKGMEVLVEISRYIRKLGIHTVSIWTMSTENYTKRAKVEVDDLMELLLFAFNRWAQEFYDEGARIIHMGRKDRLPQKLAEVIADWEIKSANHNKFCANICFDYGGHDELLRAFKKAYQDIMMGKISIDDLWSEVGLYQNKYPFLKFKDYLDTKDQPNPYPDLIIRTNGELRLSGFMPWQSVYSEIYAADELMPEFTTASLQKAIITYAKRKRTFGGNSEENNLASKEQ